MKNSKKRTLAIIPYYNEKSTISSIVLKNKQYKDGIMNFDDLCINNTEKIGRKDEVAIIYQNKNQGNSSTVINGFRYTLINNFNYIITSGDEKNR